MFKRIAICLFLVAFCLCARAADTNTLVWHRATDRVDADVRGMALWPLLEKIAVAAGWHIFVEPDTTHITSAKFKDLPSGDALKMLLGNLNFALVPRTNGGPQLYVFRTALKNATRPVLAPPAAPRHVPNELLVKLKPGTDADALAKLLGAKITGRNDKLGLYRLLFNNASATDAALGQLKGNSDMAAVDYNYYFDPPPPIQALSSAPIAPLSLQLNPPGDSGKVIVGLIDMNVQSLGAQLDKFILAQIDAAGDVSASTDITHGTAMAYNILTAIAQASGGASSVQIQPVDVYGGNQTTTSWYVALGIQAAVDHGANILNLSLGSAGDSSVLDGVVSLALADNIVIFGAAGNTPVDAPTYPGAIPGVHDVTALGMPGQLAPYANFWSGDSMALPGTGYVYYGGTPYVVQGTSTATAFASGTYAGTLGSTTMNQSQILGAMQMKYPVPLQ
jgi:hypothetical protein